MAAKSSGAVDGVLLALFAIFYSVGPKDPGEQAGSLVG
jgi:hypothetical protein